MSLPRVLAAGLVALLLCTCKPAIPKPDASRPVPQEYFHLHAIGGWGLDQDIWILPDDSYRCRLVDSRNGDIDSEHTGSSHGIFQRMVKLTDDLNGWDITTESMQAEYDRERGRVIQGVFDANHDFIEFRTKSHVLVANYYAADVFAHSFPKAAQIQAFSQLAHAAYAETKGK